MRAFALLTVASLACSDKSGSPAESSDVQLDLQIVASGLSSPLYLTAPTGDPRLFIVTQGGQIGATEAALDGGRLDRLSTNGTRLRVFAHRLPLSVDTLYNTGAAPPSTEPHAVRP